MEPVTYTVEDVAKLLGIARNSAYERVHAGDIPSIRMGRRYLTPRERFDAWLNGTDRKHEVA